MMSLGLWALASRLDLVHVDAVILAAHAIGDRLEPFARLVDGRAVRQMSAGGQVEPHEGVARLQQREEHRLVGLGAGMGLHIGEGSNRTARMRRSMASSSATSTYSQPP